MKKMFAAPVALFFELAQSGFLYVSGLGAALAIALGKFVLGGFLAVICLGVLLRLKRGRVADSETKNS